MKKYATICKTPAVLCLLATLCACGGSGGSTNHVNNATPTADEPPSEVVEPEPAYLTTGTATVSEPPAAGTISLTATNFDPAARGYRLDEYFVSGTASSFTSLSELRSDGMWEVEPAGEAHYKTRVVVFRPIDDEDFSGTVLVEWLNVSAGFDSPPGWRTGHTGIIRAGHAWVGVTAQRIGIEGAESSIVPLHLKVQASGRYDTLDHPGDSFSYDIYSQVAQAIREPKGRDILDGLEPEYLIATGESQSAFRMVSYINGIHPLYNLFDAFMVHARGSSGTALSEAPQTLIPGPNPAFLRTDLNVPVMTFQTETDLLGLRSVDARQDDTDRLRLWEVAGTAHAGYYVTVSSGDDLGDDPQFAVVIENNSVFGFIECDKPLNNGPQAWVYNAALASLDHWMRTGEAPPTAERIAVNDDRSALGRDEFGNALGGIRTPYVDVPAATLSGEGQTGNGFCRLFGTTELFDAARMSSLYTDKSGYREKVRRFTAEAVQNGFLLPEDGQRINEASGLQWNQIEKQN